MLRYTYITLCISLLVLSWCATGTPESPRNEQARSQEVLENTSNTGTSISRILANPDTPNFTEIDIDGAHKYDKNKALSFLWGTFLDIDGDKNMEFLITGGADQNDKIFRYTSWKILDITWGTGIDNSLPSYGAYSIDFDNNGSDDLFIARQDWVYYYENKNGAFTEQKLEISLPLNAVPLDIDLADIDSDGDLDMYVSTFINQDLFRAAVFNDSSHVQRNLLLRNDGDLNFIDITVESGLDFSVNTFTANFADLDNDNDVDLVISPNTDTVKIFKNEAGVFSSVYTWKNYGFWMGLAIADADRDGDQDIFWSNVGTSISERLLWWDSTDAQDVKSRYLFLENTGDMNFIEKKDSALDDLGFGWWIVSTDINLDSKPDYLIMQNYVKWAPHKLSKLPGELLEYTDSGFNAKISDYNIQNKNYGISALVGDINGDSFDDIIYLNLDNDPKVYLRNTDPKNNFLKVNIPNTSRYLFAKMTLKAWEETLATRQFLPKQWLMTKQASSIVFGLNTHTLIPTELHITYIDGSIEILELRNSNVVQL